MTQNVRTKSNIIETNNLKGTSPTGRQNPLNLLKIVKLTQNVRTKSNIIETNNLKGTSPIHKMRYSTGQESTQFTS